MNNAFFSAPSSDELRTLDAEVRKVDDYDYLLSLERYPECIRQYIKDIWESHPRVSDVELAKLFIRLHDGDLSARNAIVESNLRLVVYIALKYHMVSKMEISDIIQEGNIGLIECIHNFDITKGYKFSSYAFWYIKGSILRAITEKCRTIRIPCTAYEKYRLIESLQLKHFSTTGERLSLDEISELTGISKKKIRMLQLATSISSLDIPCELTLNINDEDVPLKFNFIDSIIDDEYNLDEIIEEEFEKEMIAKALSLLDERESLIINNYFGFNNEEPKTLEEIAKLLNLSTGHTGVLLHKAIRRIKRNLINVQRFC